MNAKILKPLNLFLTAGLFLALHNINAQDVKLSRQEQKETLKAQSEANFYRLDSLIKSKSFVIKANYVREKYGVLTPVDPTINFIMVNGTTGIVQTGSYSGVAFNGVGGSTSEGMIGLWKLTSNSKKQTFTLSFSLQTNLGNYNVLIFIKADNKTSATVTGTCTDWTVTPRWFDWDGELYSLKDARIFKGHETI